MHLITAYEFCPSCQTPHFYPVVACLSCGGKLQKQQPTTLTVSGKTTVQVASEDHQNVPYDILLLSDEFEVTHLLKTHRRYQYGDSFPNRLELNEPHAVGVKSVAYDVPSVADDLLSSLADAAKPDDKVLILISLPEARPASGGRISDPRLILSAVDALRGAGVAPERITLAARHPRGIEQKTLLSKTGFSELAQAYAWIDLSQSPYETLTEGDQLYDIPKQLLGTTLMVNSFALAPFTQRSDLPATFTLANLLAGDTATNARRVSGLDPMQTNVFPRTLHLVDAHAIGRLRTRWLMASWSHLALDRILGDLLLPAKTLNKIPAELVGIEWPVLKNAFAL